MVLVVANGESLAQQIPYVIAFAMFGVVGALIVSRDRRNTIGLLFLWAAFLTAFSFLSGEVLTRAVADGQTGWWLVLCGYLNNAGWLFGILPTIFLLPLLFPDGHLPSARWRPFLWLVVAFLVIVAIDLTFGQRTLTGSTEAGVSQPLLRRRRRASAQPGPRDRRAVPPDLRDVGDVARPPVPPIDGRGATADQVGRVRVRGGARRLHQHHVLDPGNHRERGDRRRNLPPASRLDRGGGPAVPPLRPRRRRPEDPDLRRVRALRDGSSTSRSWSASASGWDATTRS